MDNDLKQTNLDLTSRPESTRDKTSAAVSILELDEIEEIFKSDVNAINKTLVLANEQKIKGQGVLFEGLMRSQIVFIESTFDYICHALIKYGLKQVYDGNWERTSFYDNYLIPIKIIADNDYSNVAFESIVQYVNLKISSDTFLGYKKFNKFFRIVGEDIVVLVSKELFPNKPENECREELCKMINSAYNRRNQIAHQSDRSHETGETIEITMGQTKECIASIKKIIKALIKVYREY